MDNIDDIFLINAHLKMQKTTYFAHIKMQSGTITRKIGSMSTTNAYRNVHAYYLPLVIN